MTASGALRQLGKRKARYGVEATPESVEAFAKKHLNSRQIKRLIDLLTASSIDKFHDCKPIPLTGGFVIWLNHTIASQCEEVR